MSARQRVRRPRLPQSLPAALLCCLLVSLSVLQLPPAAAAEETADAIQIPENLTPEQARELVARLSDEQVREIVISQLDKVAAAQQTQGDPSIYIGQLRNGIKVAADRFVSMYRSRDRVTTLPAAFARQLTEDGRVGGWTLLAQLIGLLLAGWIGERLVRRLLSRTAEPAAGRLSLGKRFDLAAYALLTGLAQLGAFAAGAALFITTAGRPTPVAQDFWFDLLGALLWLKLVWLVLRALVSHVDADNRLIKVSATAARQIRFWSMLLTAILVLPGPILRVAAGHGADADLELLLAFIVGLVFILLLLVLIVRLRRYGASLILREDGENGPIRQGFARSWWALAGVYVLLVWLLSIGRRAATGESSLLPGLASLGLVALIPYFDRGLKWLIGWYFAGKEQSPGDATSAAENRETAAAAADTGAAPGNGIAAPQIPAGAANQRAPAYIAIALRYARVIMVLCVLMIFLHLWGIDVRALSAQLVGPRFASALFDISITVLLTWALWGMIRISIERKLDEGKPAGAEGEGDSEAGGLGGSRVETVLPLIRMFIKISLVVMAALISLSSLGVNIGPLIAGAGVVGIAIGFGAQTLVRDIVSGFFYLLDDAFRIGEYVVIDNIRGTVEKISIRSFQLRHHEGPVHTIPYGEIRTLTNWSRDWAIMKFELRIPFETDIDLVRKIIKQIGLDMAADPVFGPLMLAPLKSQGVNRMDDSALIIRCKFTALPGQQYLIRREAFTRIQRAFEEKGIHFAPRRVLVEATTPAQAIQAAAASLDSEEQDSSAKHKQ